MEELKSYCGNGKPFLYALYPGEDANEARAVCAVLQDKGYSLCPSDTFTGREEKKLSKAGALLLFLSPGNGQSEQARNAAALAGGLKVPVISVYLKPTELSPALSLLLGSYQGLLKYDFPKEEDFYNKLLSSPVLSSLAVTPGQKKAAKKTLAGLLLGGAALSVLLILLLLDPFRFFSGIDPDSTLGQLGLSGSALSVKTLYVYGGDVEEKYYFPSHKRIAEEEYLEKLYIRELDLIPAEGFLTDISDFAQLENLEELCLAGNGIEDITPLSNLKKLHMLDLSNNPLSAGIECLTSLPSLEVLNLSYCDGLEDLSPLLACPALETVYINCNQTYLVEALGKTNFDVIYVQAPVYSFEELQKALNDPEVYDVFVMAEITIPQGESLTVHTDVALGGVNIVFTNNGTLIVEGSFELGLSEATNNGTMTVAPGGVLSGGMGNISNNGQLTLEEGAFLYLERGQWMTLNGGAFVNRGYIRVQDGGRLQFLGGAFENDGLIEQYSPDNEYGGQFEGDRSAITGSGEFIVYK